MLRVRSVGTMLLALLATLLLAACGSGDRAGSAGDGAAAKAIPATALVYFDANLKQGGDANNAATLLSGIFGKTPSQLITDMRRPGADRMPDMTSLLNGQVAVGLLSTQNQNISGQSQDFIVAAEVTDTEQALADFTKGRQDLTEAAHNGTRYIRQQSGPAFAVVDGIAIFGSREEAFKKGVDALKNGNSIANSNRFKKAVGELDSKRLATFYTDLQALITQSGANTLSPLTVGNMIGALRAATGSDDLSVTAGLTANKNAIALDLRVPAIKGSETFGGAEKLLAEAPANASFAFALGDLGKHVNDLLRQTMLKSAPVQQLIQQLYRQFQLPTGDPIENVIAAIGDSVFFLDLHALTLDRIPGDSTTIIKIKDKRRAASIFNMIETMFRQAGLTTERKMISGATVATAAPHTNSPKGAKSAVIALTNEKFIVTSSEQGVTDALTPKNKLADNDSFKSAKDNLDGTKPMLFLNLAQIAQTPAVQQSNNESLRYLQKLGALMVGAKKDGNKTRLRALLTLK